MRVRIRDGEDQGLILKEGGFSARELGAMSPGLRDGIRDWYSRKEDSVHGNWGQYLQGSEMLGYRDQEPVC